MVGACIPVLRVLIRHVRSTAGRYYVADDPSELPASTWPGWKAAGAGAGKVSHGSSARTLGADDDGSERSILTAGTPAFKREDILRVCEVVIEPSLHRGDANVFGHNDAYEVGKLRSI